jgi:hypothetical protein
MELTINTIELASELADMELRKNWDYRLGEIDIDREFEVCYTDEAQDVFDELYDKYLGMIENCSV